MTPFRVRPDICDFFLMGLMTPLFKGHGTELGNRCSEVTDSDLLRLLGNGAHHPPPLLAKAWRVQVRVQMCQSPRMMSGWPLIRLSGPVLTLGVCMGRHMVKLKRQGITPLKHSSPSPPPHRHQRGSDVLLLNWLNSSGSGDSPPPLV